MDKILEYIGRLFVSTGPWLSKQWLWKLPVIGVLIALLLLHFNLIPTIPEKEGQITIQYYKWLIIMGLPILFEIIWVIGTQSYLRTGSGVKIGVAYEGYKVDLADWKQTRVILKDLFQDDKIKNKVSLRFVPLRAVQAEKIGQKFARRYGFTILLTLEESTTKDNKKQVKFGLSINTKQQVLPYLKTTVQHCMAIIAARSNNQDQTALDMLKNKALNLHDLLLLFVATHNFVTENYEDASVILQHIDQELAKARLEPMKPPRFQIRDFFVRSCVSKLSFPLNQIPSPDDLEKRIQFAERALPLFNEFAGVYTSLSRAKFLIGDVPAAVQLTERFKARIEELQKAGQTINADVMFTSHLNSGFLSFIQGHWENAFHSFYQMFKVQGYKQDWNALVEFIDYVDSLEQFEGTCYLKVLYRKIAGQPVSTPLNQVAMDWIHVDGSRKVFESLFSSVPRINTTTSNKQRQQARRKKPKSRKRRK